ncbi:AraC family transcriptional regulator [Ruminococcaceae bacterium OttesenSCG-928-A16]|nr:AraC family transcriptional regulator [Ruminococcaceae bacterium OttesenSCG-928-A16]
MVIDWLTGMNKALDYIEENLQDTIDPRRAAKLACCSFYHFTRMFGYVTGVPLAEYIRRRRLSAAALELASSNVKVIELAQRYGYDSPTAFNRAFKALHGLTPTGARLPGASLKSFPRISFQLSIKGDVAMNYKIEDRGAFSIVGFKQWVSVEDGANVREIPKMWANLTPKKMQELCALMEGEPMGILGVCADMHDNGFDYYIAATSKQAAPAGMQGKDIPAATWAIFESIGPIPGAIQDVWKRIYSEWMPTSGYTHAGLPELEVYPDGDNTSPTYRCEVWIPVTKA